MDLGLILYLSFMCLNWNTPANDHFEVFNVLFLKTTPKIKGAGQKDKNNQPPKEQQVKKQQQQQPPPKDQQVKKNFV